MFSKLCNADHINISTILVDVLETDLEIRLEEQVFRTPVFPVI